MSTVFSKTEPVAVTPHIDDHAVMKQSVQECRGNDEMIRKTNLWCPECGSRDVVRKGTVTRSFRAAPIGLKPVFIVLAVQRVLSGSLFHSSFSASDMKYLPCQIFGFIPDRKQHCFGHIEDLPEPPAGNRLQKIPSK